MDVYKRVAELMSSDSKISDAAFFTSPEYKRFIRHKAENIVAGSCYSLRKKGFQVSNIEEKEMIDSLVVEIDYDPKNPVPAYSCNKAGSRGNYIFINAGHEVVTVHRDRDDQHNAVLGLLYHELGHFLYTDFPTLRAWNNQLLKGQWFPNAPEETVSTTNGINLQAKMADNNFCMVLDKCADYLENSIEDAYIENEMSEMCPGRGVLSLSMLNTTQIEGLEDLEKSLQNKEASIFGILLNQILCYAKYNEMHIGNYDGEYSDVLYDCMDIIEETRYQRDPLLRCAGTNRLLCVLFPYLDAEIKKMQNQQGQNQQGQNQQGQGQQGSSGPVSQQIADQIMQQIQQVAQKAGAANTNKDATSKSINNPTAPRNSGAQAQQEPHGNGNGSSSPVGSSTGEGLKKAAERDVNSLMQEISTNKATEQAEKERSQEMNREAKDADYSEYGGGPMRNIKIERAASVSEVNRQSYDEASPIIKSVSADLQRGIKRVLKDRRQGGKRKNLPFGRRLEVSSIVHNDGKYFSRTKLPTESPKLGVGLLIDESGSTQGQLISASMKAALVIEDFCRELDIPHIINGYTTGSGGVLITSYAEPQEVDNSNRYRLTGMSAKGGTPTCAAMMYMGKRMEKLDCDVRLLIIITDGRSDGQGNIPAVIAAMKRKKTMVAVAGIGDNRASVESEFQQEFMDISDVDEMPDTLVQIIKKNLIV